MKKSTEKYLMWGGLAALAYWLYQNASGIDNTSSGIYGSTSQQNAAQSGNPTSDTENYPGV